MAELLSFSTRWVRALVKRYNEGGPAALGDQRIRNGTKPTILRPRRWLRLRSGSRRRLMTAACGRGRKLRAGSPNSIGSHPCTISVAGTRLLRSAIRSNSRGHGILGRDRGGSCRAQKNSRPRRPRNGAAPGATVEVWAMDEHRIGLKPITRGVWAPIGERPIALGHHRFEWLYVTGFVEPTSGRTVWNVSNAVCKELFDLFSLISPRRSAPGQEAHRASARRCWLARPKEPGRARRHPPRSQPAHSPELQPAEHLWPFVDEPLANRCFATIASLDQAVGDRCVALAQQQDMIRNSTLFHWWPRQRARN